MTELSQAVRRPEPPGGPQRAPGTPRPPKREKNMGGRLWRRAEPWFLRGIVPFIVLGIWAFVADREMVSALILPEPGEVWSKLWSGLVTEGGWNDDLWVTLRATLKAFAIGLGLGLAGGVLFAFFDRTRVALYPYVLALQAFPKIAVAPLLIVWLGYGESPKVVIGASLAVFPVLTATFAGLTEIGKDELNLLRSIRATRLQELRYLRLPNSMSYIFPSLDLAILCALLGVITGEVVGSNSGLGYLIQERTVYGDSASVFAVLLILAAIGLVLSALALAVKRALPRSIVPR
ncbi:ABC transporter permease [Actinomadura welshii]